MAASVSEADLINGFRVLGIKESMMLEVHCSMSSFGKVQGGAKTIIHSLKAVVGKEGAIVMPSFKLSPNLPLTEYDKQLGIKLKIKKLASDDEKSAMGIVSDTFRNMPDVITGDGLFRVSAWGKNAEKHAQGFQYLIDSGGYALLLGVDIYSMSSMHYVEDCMPDLIKDKFKPTDEARALYPEDEWLIESWAPAVKPWYTIQDAAYQRGYIQDCMIGSSKCMLVQVQETTKLYRDALQTSPWKLYGLE